MRRSLDARIRRGLSAAVLVAAVAIAVGVDTGLRNCTGLLPRGFGTAMRIGRPRT
jgi:hypothetical protein